MSARRTPAGREQLRGDIAATLMPGFTGTELPDWLAARLRDGLAGVCVFGGNIASVVQLRRLTDAIRRCNPDALVAIDEEGGDVTRLHYDVGSPFPGPAVLGRIDDIAVTEAVGRAVAAALAEAGCSLNFAPVADVNSDADNPVIGVRSFGSDARAASAHVAAWVRGHASQGIAVSAKHFPGHGDTAADSHLALPVIEADLDALRGRELMPFRAAIAAGAQTVMTSHILIPALDAEHPATHSPRILDGLLRGELGFDGVIVSDALDMAGASAEHGIPEAAVRALAAGCDLLCIGTDNTDAQLAGIEQAVLDAVDAGRLDAARIRDAAGRVRALGRVANAVIADPPAGGAGGAAGDAVDLDVVIGAFELSERARSWIETGERPATVLRIDTVANIAVGLAPWGPFAAIASSGAGAESAWSRVVAVPPGVDPRTLDVTAPIVVVGRDVHRYPFARRVIDGLRASGQAVLVVDMGWPSDDRSYADIATFGASRLVGRALLALLDGDEAR